MDAHRGGDVGHVVLVAGGDDLVIPARHLRGEAVEGIAAHAMQAHHAGALGQLGIARHQHAALAGGHGLVGIEAEHGGVAAHRADQFALERRRQRMGGVFDHAQAMAARDVEDLQHVDRQTGVMDRDDRAGARRDRGLDQFGVDVQRCRVDVDQHHIGAQVADNFGRGGKGMGGGDDLVARADAQRFERQMQAGGGRIDGDAFDLRLGQKFGKSQFEALCFRAGGDPTRTQGIDHFVDLVLANFGQGERQKGQGGWRAGVGGHIKVKRCFGLAPLTACSEMPGSRLTNRASCSTASASR